MHHNQLKNIVIVGGGTAGWMAGALMSKYMPSKSTKITLIESEEIGTVGVGEATIPHLENFNHLLGIDEATFMKKTHATFKLGIDFVDWYKKGESYIHPFGDYGIEMNGLQFYHYWGRMKALGETFPLEAYSMNIAAARAGKFIRPVADPSSLASRIRHAYHLDASMYAKFLREFAESHGANRIEGKVIEVHQRAEDGFLTGVTLDSGQKIEGDLFLDCTGFRGLLIEGALETGYEDWSHYLPMDRALAVPTSKVGDPPPYTVATARDAGWTWRIPLQHRVGNGHVYSSKYMDKAQAEKILLDNIIGEPLAEPKQLFFKTGRRNKFWNKNCVALGLSSGFLEPLESTSIHLIQEGLVRLLALMPDMNFNAENSKEYNRVMGLSYERIRDFILLHYVATIRDDTPFWRDVQAIELPETLEHRMRLLCESGHYVKYEQDLFWLDSWLAVMDGQGFSPKIYSPLADAMDERQLAQTMAQLRHAVSEITRQMPTHQQFINQYCKSN
ncbi:tryptophan halogenase family protein [Hirschia litorea]|uniref:Tryptophan halogenase family protein n=1 Tax=Hirschia litorea TaxID=1199156 RepID=A0ABW2INV4_9PROT